MRPTRVKSVTEARYDEGIEAGRLAERASIVAFIREMSEHPSLELLSAHLSILSDSLEAGAHNE